MRLIAALIVAFGFASPGLLADDGPLELLNSTLITKLHLDRTANRGQMVGAYQVSFRNTSGSPISSVSLLLNPSLSYTKVTGAGGRILSAPSNMTAVAGYELLELNAVTVQLTEPLGADKRTEIVVHYKGYLTNMTYLAIDGVKETLSPDFTMIRADSFGYPVFAEPKRSSIDAAFAHKPFRQVAFIEYPGSNDIAGTLKVVEKALNGGNTKVEMKSPVPTGLFAAAIAPFSNLNAGSISISFLQGSTASAQNFLTLAGREARRIEGLLGQAAAGAELRMVELPDGYKNTGNYGTYFRPAAAFGAAVVEPQISAGLLDLWRPIGAGNPGHWSNGLNAVVRVAISAPDELRALQQTKFDETKTLFSTDKNIGKTSLADYAVEGYSGQSDAVSTLAYAALYNILGPDAFFNFIKELMAEVRGQYADAEVVADFMKSNIKDKFAKKFVKNWFSSGKAVKDMAKAKSFEELLQRYN